MDELGKKLDKEKEKDLKKKKLALQGRYSQRITVAKNGREMFLSKDYVGAAKKYNEYLGILAELHDLENIYELSPSMFDGQADLTEMLLISHVYWELARVYEMTPKLQKAFDKSLKQFVRFTVNQPYQVLNSEMLRKYIKSNKKRSRQIQALDKAYSQIHIQSKKCFVSTMAFGNNHWVTRELRRFKSSRLKGRLGVHITGLYYRSSAGLVSALERRPLRKKFSIVVARPPLIAMAAAHRLFRK